MFSNGRFKRYRTRFRGRLKITYWLDCMTGHLYATQERI